MHDPTIVTQSDLHRLETLAARMQGNPRDAAALDDLRERLQAAVAVGADEVPGDVVTLDSHVTIREIATGRRLRLTVVAPDQADPAAGRVSVLAPLGAALLGGRAGRDVHWKSLHGPQRIRIEQVTFQPEAARRGERAASS